MEREQERERDREKFKSVENVNERRKNAINSKYLIGANLFACFSPCYYLIFIHMFGKFVGCILYILNYST